jgi:hypothetical protein
MLNIRGAEVAQLVVGGIVGAALSINMCKHGMSILDPKTRWQSLSLIGSFLFAFLSLTDALIN